MVFRKVCVILKNKVGFFIFSVVDKEFYLFLRFCGFNVSVCGVRLYLIVSFGVFMHLILVVLVYFVSVL